MAESGTMFRRVREVIYFQHARGATRGSTGQIVPGIWERVALVDRLGPDRVDELEREDVITHPRVPPGTSPP